jgi:uncharacterized protein
MDEGEIRMFRAIVYVVALHATFSMAFAASSGCNSSSGNGVCPEAVICGLSELSTLDEKVDKAYQTMLGQRTGAAAEQLKSEQQAWLASRNACGCDPTCIEREYQHRVAELDRVAASPQTSLPSQATGVWGSSKRACDLHKWGRLENVSSAQALRFGVIKITGSDIQRMYGEKTSCAISLAELATSHLSISFPARCTSKDRQSGQFIIINMHGNNNMRLSVLAAAPVFNTADYVRCVP